MNRLLILPVLLLTLLVWNLAFSADLQKGMDAFDREDYATALREWKPLAEKGYALAQNNLGVMYEKGQGVSQNYKTAVKWYTLAAEQGYALAQFNLGVMYDKGEGVIQDYVRAHMWGNLGAYNGNENGAKLRDLVAKKMTPSQLEKTQDLARECMKKNYRGY